MTIRTNLSLEVIENCMNINNRNLCTYCFEEIFDSQGPCSSCGYVEGRKPQDAVLATGTILMGRYTVGKVLGKWLTIRSLLCIGIFYIPKYF